MFGARTSGHLRRSMRRCAEIDAEAYRSVNSHSAQQNGQIAENRADQHHLRRRFVPDSPLEGSGFEL